LNRETEGIVSSIVGRKISITFAVLFTIGFVVAILLSIKKPFPMFTIEVTGEGQIELVVPEKGNLFLEDGVLDADRMAKLGIAIGSPVVLRAIPKAGSSFSRWEGACAGHLPTCVFAAESANMVGAHFTRQ
jgi:hypothetical protein